MILHTGTTCRCRTLGAGNCYKFTRQEYAAYLIGSGFSRASVVNNQSNLKSFDSELLESTIDTATLSRSVVNSKTKNTVREKKKRQ